MSIRYNGLAVLSPFMRRAFALACVTSLLITSSTKAATVLQFSQVNSAQPSPDVVTATESGGVTTLSSAGNAGTPGSIPVVVTNFNGVPFPFGIPLFETLTAVSAGAATSSGGTITQNFSGIVTFSSLPEGAGTDYLTATFANAALSGSGNSASLNATAPNLVFTSELVSFPTNTGLSIAFTLVNGAPLSISGGSIASFTATNAGTLSAAAAVPEPSALCLASFAAVIGTLAAAYGKKRMKNEPAN
jgi:hypothetical protein